MPRGLSVRPVRGQPKREAPSSSNTIQADVEKAPALGTRASREPALPREASGGARLGPSQKGDLPNPASG